MELVSQYDLPVARFDGGGELTSETVLIGCGLYFQLEVGKNPRMRILDNSLLLSRSI